MALHGKDLLKLKGACATGGASPAKTLPKIAHSQSKGEPLPSGGGSSSVGGSLSEPASPVIKLPPLPTPPQSRRRTNVRTIVEAPRFLQEGGTYAEKVTVGLSVAAQGVKIRYLVERLPDEEEEEEESQGTHSKLALSGLTYCRPFVLDEYGVYAVHAACVREDTEIQVSDVVSERFELRPTETVALRGRPLAELPQQMVRGMLRFAGATCKVIAPRLETMKRAIARAAKTVEDSVCVHIKEPKKGGPPASGVEVSFSVRVDGGREEAEEMSKGITDPSLVNRVAAQTGLKCKITVEAKAERLERVLLHLAWTFPDGRTDYLDGSCLVYAGDRLLDVVDYRGAESVRHHGASSATHEWSAGKGEKATVLHSGDVMTRGGGRHAIYVRLGDLPEMVTQCFFTLSAYNCRNLSKFKHPRVLLFDADDSKHLLTQYEVADAGCASAAVVCSLSRHWRTGAWSVVAYGQTCDGTVRDYAPIEASIAPVQAKYGRWNRRAPIIRLSALWHENRALPRATLDKEDVVVPLLELEEDLFKHVVSFL